MRRHQRFVTADYEPAMSYDDIGTALSLTGERVRQIEVGALAKLRRSRVLRECWSLPYEDPRPLNGADGNTWRRARL